MKKLSLLTILAILISGSCFAKIWRVNNNVGIVADFTTLQAAHNGAVSGDTLYLEGSPTSYGSLTCTKKLSIIGTGYFLDQNLNLQANAAVSKVSGITFNAGSAGSSLQGVMLSNSNVIINVNDILIRRNYFGAPNGSNPIYNAQPNLVQLNSNASNIFITQNFCVTIYAPGTSTGILIINNLIAIGTEYGDNNTSSSCLDLSPNCIAIVKNNVFRNGRATIYNSNLSNNIMYTGALVGTGNLLSNNIGNSTQFGTATGNQSGVSMATVFEGTGTFDGAYKLKAGSPAIGAGYGSTAQTPVDAGMYSGSTPYVLSGIPAIPSIYFFSNQPVGSNSDPIKVQVKVRSNN